MITDKYKYGTLIAKFMGGRISDEERGYLDEWILQSERNARLFEELIDDFNVFHARKWFDDAGVDTSFIKWPNWEKWYKPAPYNTIGFYYMLAIIMLIMLMIFHLVIKFT